MTYSVGDRSTESSGKSGAGEDEGYAYASLVGFVPKGEIIYETRLSRLSD